MATEKPHLQYCSDILNELVDDVVERYLEADKLYVREGPSNRKKVSTQPLLPKLQKLGFRVQEKAQRIDFGEIDHPRPLRHNHKQHFVGQVESWEQVQNDSCGYFALQNATNLVMGAMVENEAESERYLKNILSPASFWVNHSKYKKRLLKVAKKKSSDSDYQWTPKHINLGILERSFAQELLFGDTIHPLRNNASLLPEFGLGFLCHNGFQRRTMAAMREIFDKFQKRTHYIHAFIIGQTNHWITVVVNKIGDKTETFLIDSRNRFALDFSKEEIFNFVETHLKHRPPYIRELVQLSMRDNQFSSDFLASCGRGLTDIYGYLLNLTLSHFLYGCYAALHELPRETDEFNLDVLKMEFDVKTAQKDLVTWHQRLSTWLSVYFPTPVIETNVIGCIHNAGLDNMSPYLHNKFKEWTIYIRKNLDKIQKEHKKLGLEWIGDVRRLSKILVWFEATFV